MSNNYTRVDSILHKDILYKENVNGVKKIILHDTEGQNYADIIYATEERANFDKHIQERLYNIDKITFTVFKEKA